MEKFAGLDVHSKMTTFVVQTVDGELVAQGEIETTSEALGAFVREHGLEGRPVGLESGSVSFYVAQQLVAGGAMPVIINAAEVRAKARSKRQKSDSRDAFEICDGLRRDIYVSIVHVPDALSRKLRRILATRRHFIVARSAQGNAIKSLLRAEGLRGLLKVKSIASDKALKALTDNPLLPAMLCELIEQHRQMWNAAQAQVKKLDELLEKLADEYSNKLGRLQQIPGIGPIVGLTVLAFLNDAQRFDSAKHVGSYAGLVPTTYDSGERERHGRITKRGPRELRAMLVEAAHHAYRPTHPLHTFYLRLKMRHGAKSALVAVAHKLLRIMWAMLHNETAFDATKHRPSRWAELAEVAA